MTKEEIDGIVAESFKKAVDNQFALKFIENVEEYDAVLKAQGIKDSFQIASCLGCIKTAQDNCIEAMRETLYKILCD